MFFYLPIGFIASSTLIAAAAVATATAAVVGTTVSISKGTSAKKKAKGQAEQAERIRAEEIKKSKALVTQAGGLEATAKKKAAAIAAGKKQRRRTTLATGPRGLLEEPDVTKPELFGT